MKFGISCDIYWETKVDEFLDITNNKLTSIGEFFHERYYGDQPSEIFLVLMCREPTLNFKQRKRFSKKENILYLDIMLDYEQMISTERTKRNEIIANKIIFELINVLRDYNFPGFQLNLFKTNLIEYFVEINQLKLPNIT